MIFMVKVKGGLGGIHISDVASILPDVSAPKTRSVIYTGLFPTGITVEGNSEKLIGMWGLQLELWANGEEEDEDDSVICETCTEAGLDNCECVALDFLDE